MFRPVRQLASILSLSDHRGGFIGVGRDVDDLVGVRDGPDDIIGVAGSSRQQPGARHHGKIRPPTSSAKAAPLSNDKPLVAMSWMS